MQKVLYTYEVQDYTDYIDSKVVDYIRLGQTEAFEGYADFDLLAFDWYDVRDACSEVSQILVYLDRDDLFFLCEEQRSFNCANALLVPPGKSNEEALYLFFVGLLKADMPHLDLLEDEITESENAALRDSRKLYLEKIKGYRKELLCLKRYYEQLVSIFENLAANNDSLLTRDAVRRFTILQNRAERFYNSVLSLRDYVTQMREAYQSQIDIEQNNLMRLFTVITAVFLPLTLLVGWYGMNFQNMPELSWKYGYPVIIAVSILLSVGLIVYFKKKKWF